MKILSTAIIAIFLASCSKPIDPTGVYIINSGWAVSKYDIQSSGKASIVGQVNLSGIAGSWKTQGAWIMDGNALTISAPRDKNLDPSGTITDYKFTIEPNGDLITLKCDEFDEGLRAVKQ